MYSLDNRHSLALPYWARPGLMSFAKPADGGGGNDDEDDDEDDEDDDDDDDDPDEGKTPEELATELKAVRKSLEKANGSSAKRRGKLRERERELDELRKAAPKGKSKSKDDDDDDDAPDVESIRSTALAEGKKEGERLVKAAKVEAGLTRAGVTETKAIARLVRMIELDDLDLDDDGTLDGLDDAIDELKADMPGLFGSTRKRRSVAGDADDGKESKSAKGKSASERQAASLMGKTS
jgi:hypothetical protein